MKNYFSPFHLIFFVLLLGIMMMLIQVELLSFAFAKLGLSPETGVMVLLLSLLGSVVNLPVAKIKSYAPIQGLGIGMPILVAPASAAMVGLLISPEQSAALAYISGTLGVLIGADLLRMKDISRLGTPYASIGGAGTFDGIFITGIVAALLA